jgi:hypothetical protein
MNEFLLNKNNTVSNMINNSFSLIPRMIEMVDVYFDEEEDNRKKEKKKNNSMNKNHDDINNNDVDFKFASREINFKTIGDLPSKCNDFINESIKQTPSCSNCSSFNNFFDLSGCLVVGDIHGNLTALLHVSDLIDRMMLPEIKYVKIKIYLLYIWI